MLSFVQNWFGPKPLPIGIDFGSDGLRLAQVQYVGRNEHRLVAAASCDVPSLVRHDPSARLDFFVTAVRDLLSQGGFRGRQAVLSLPASVMHILHLRMAKLDDAEMKKAIAFEARGKLPIDPSAALIRHLIAGEIFSDNEPKNEVILLAARREWVNQFLAAASRAKLDVIGMNVEPSAVIDCFSHVYRRKTDADATHCYVDIGFAGTRAVIARGGQILFARSIPIGGEHLTRAVADALKISFEDAKLERIKLALDQPSLDEHRDQRAVTPAPVDAPPTDPTPADACDNSFALPSAALSKQNGQHTVAPATGRMGDLVPPGAPAALVPEPALPLDPAQQRAQRVNQACTELLDRLVSELSMCRRYYEATFPAKPVERLIFIGGEARHRTLCQYVARSMQLAAQVGDPMVRMARTSEVGIESGIDRRQPQPGWAVAIGLSMGPVLVDASK